MSSARRAGPRPADRCASHDSTTDRPLAPIEPTPRSGHLVGLGACVAIGLVAYGLGHLIPVVGAPPIAIVLGAIAGPLLRSRASERSLAVARTYVLQAAVVLLGVQLSIRQLASVGTSSLPVMLGTLVAGLVAALVIGRWLGIGGDLRVLIGVGTAVCGASAIAAVSPVIKARSTDVSYAVATIFLFNVAAVLAFPPLGHALGLGQADFGLFAGTAVNDTSSVVAAASSYGAEAANHAVVVKLSRTLMIIPICLVLAVRTRRGELWSGSQRRAWVRAAQLVPPMLIGFVLLCTVNSLAPLPGALTAAAAHVTQVLISVALAGIGVSTDVRAFRRVGARPLVLGVALWTVVALSSLGLQMIVS